MLTSGLASGLGAVEVEKAEQEDWVVLWQPIRDVLISMMIVLVIFTSLCNCPYVKDTSGKASRSLFFPRISEQSSD